ncbi:hypothetical protein GQX73_g8658 [Xylaria multiplex]|uniref:Uncharacterized protein n=1 Tax=Xylaria multiplex TaxID=323545 RepID=A0A7C8MPD1_9PEZI|nr:hypothetical protein GQX73_g8658 [Xylaria multiplex]
MWPFRRRGSRRRSRTAPIDNPNIETSGNSYQYQPAARTKTEPASITPNAANTGGGSRIPQRRGRAYSYSPGRQDSLPVAKLRKRNTVQVRESTPAVDTAQRMPTLYHDNSRNKRRGQPLLHKKSSKRRKEDHDREAEIKAMSQFIPARPATDQWTAGRPIKRESRQFRSSVTDQPSSDISLPVPESIHSAMSSDSEQISWKVSAFDALSPRPTLRYSSNPIASSAPGSGLARSHSTRKKIVGSMTLPESTLHDHRRIHDLADDFDASDLRELMERDKRRRERKAEKERERAQRRLARRSEKQRAEEAAAAASGTPPPENLERGVLGRELPDSSDHRTSAVITSSRRRSSSDSPRRRSRPSSEIGHLENRGKTPSPLDEFYRTDSIPPPESSSPVQATESAISSKQAESTATRSSSPRLFGFIRSKKSRSTSPTQPEQPIPTTVHSPPTTSIKLDDAESVSRTSDSRSSRPWLSLFKWGKNRRGSGPSSFSNTSRDSMLGNQPIPPTNYIPRKTNSAVPKRTMSRFREDLPELPISPPDSRVASPEAEPIPVEPLPVIPDDVVMRYDTPIESHKYQEVMRATPVSMQRDEVQPSPALHSMSLASVDSEASWLSGRISRKRTSSGMRTSLQYPPRTVSALSGRSEGQASEHTEDDNIVDDEYLNSVVPSRLRRLSTGEARPSSDEEEELSPKWGAVGQTPTVIQHSETMRSREGVLQSFDDDKEFSNANESEEDGDGQSPVEPQRATSVKLGKGHFRNFSAGSAKLLEISPRPSGDHKMSNQ